MLWLATSDGPGLVVLVAVLAASDGPGLVVLVAGLVLVAVLVSWG